jgi:hypothetical protein
LFIFFFSCSAESILGYNPNEIIDQSVHRILPTECLTILEQAKQNCRKFLFRIKTMRFSRILFLVSGEHCTSMNVLDLFTRNGDRLTFLCNTHMLVEGRRKTMKLGFLAQLIEYVKY